MEAKYERDTIFAREYWSNRWKCRCGSINMKFQKTCWRCGLKQPIQLTLESFVGVEESA